MSIAEIRSCVDNCESEMKLLAAGRKISATRARAHLQRVRAIAQALRLSIIADVKAMPTRPRGKVTKSETEAKKLIENVLDIEIAEISEPVVPVVEVETPNTTPVFKPKRIRKSKAASNALS